MANHRLYSGTVLLIAAVAFDALDAAWPGVVMLAVMGFLLTVSSYAPEGERR